MADPVIVSSGHTFERNCILACVPLSFNPPLQEGGAANFSTLIPNLALKDTILNWCRENLVDPPKPIDLISTEKIVYKSISPTELTRSPSEVSVATSLEESVATPRNGGATTTPPFTTQPSCYSVILKFQPSCYSVILRPPLFFAGGPTKR